MGAFFASNKMPERYRMTCKRPRRHCAHGVLTHTHTPNRGLAVSFFSHFICCSQTAFVCDVFFLKSSGFHCTRNMFSVCKCEKGRSVSKGRFNVELLNHILLHYGMCPFVCMFKHKETNYCLLLEDDDSTFR